jgi:glycosyltransferase involved in cell wall biosynthesis
LRLLFVCKRHPQQRDLVTRPYGRFFNLPTALAGLGHEVAVTLCSHRALPTERFQRDGVDWASEDVRTRGPARFLAAVDARAADFSPDWVIGCSDTWYGILARRLARRRGARLAIDAYDNYEAYMPWNKPLHWQWRRSVRSAELVTAAGPQLAALLQRHRSGGRPVEVLPMTADPEFVPLDREQCRMRMQLPLHAPLVGYVGSWTRNRGTYLLMDAFARIHAALPEARLVLSGRPPAEVLNEPNVVGLGYVADADLPVLVNALDVACVVTAETSFGRYSYPAKLCEAMSCGVPTVATATDAVRWMLGGREQHLAPVDDAVGFADRVLALLHSPDTNYAPLSNWEDIAARWEGLLSQP